MQFHDNTWRGGRCRLTPTVVPVNRQGENAIRFRIEWLFVVSLDSAKLRGAILKMDHNALPDAAVESAPMSHARKVAGAIVCSWSSSRSRADLGQEERK